MKTTLLFTFVLGMTLNVHAESKKFCDESRDLDIEVGKSSLEVAETYKQCLKENAPSAYRELLEKEDKLSESEREKAERLGMIETKKFSSEDIKKLFRRSVIAYSYDSNQNKVAWDSGSRLTSGDDLCKKLTQDKDAKASESIVEKAPESEKAGVIYAGLFSKAPEIVRLDDDRKVFSKYKSISCAVVSEEGKKKIAGFDSSPLSLITEVVEGYSGVKLGETKKSGDSSIVEKKTKEEASYISSDFQSLIDKSQNVSR